jgi:hypothetical protein
MLHVEITVASSQFSCLSTASARMSRKQLSASESAHHMGAPFDLLIESLEHAGAFHVLVMGERQPIVGQCRPRFFKLKRKFFQLDGLSRLARLTAKIWRRPSQSTATAISTA